MILHSLILGEGKPFVILHGFLGMADNWKTLGTLWSESGFQVHLLDQRNHGRSFHNDEHSYDAMAQDLKMYCDHLHLDHIILLGHSMGGKVAMHAASLFPQLIDKLIIADIAPKAYDPHHSDIIHALESVDFEQISSRKEADDAVAVRIKDHGTRQFLLKSLYRKNKTTYDWRFNLPVLARSQAMIGSHNRIDTPIQIPTLFIRGGNSGYILDVDKAGIEHAFAKAELQTIPNAGHWLHAEQPVVFNKLVAEFVK